MKLLMMAAAGLALAVVAMMGSIFGKPQALVAQVQGTPTPAVPTATPTPAGIDLSPWVDVFVKGTLKGVLLAWPVWVVLGLIVAGCLVLGTYRRVKRGQSRSDWP